MNPVLGVILFLSCQGAVPRPAPPDEMHPYVRVRGGSWYSQGFTFEAVRIDGRRSFEGKDAAFAGLEVGFEVGDRYFSFVGVEQALSGDISLRTASIGAGGSLEVGSPSPAFDPVVLSPYFAVTYGTFEVDKEGFGDFRPGAGLRMGVEADLPVAEFLRVGLFVEGRYARFGYEEDVVDGDEHAVGLSLAAGFGAVLKF